MTFKEFIEMNRRVEEIDEYFSNPITKPEELAKIQELVRFNKQLSQEILDLAKKLVEVRHGG